MLMSVIEEAQAVLSHPELAGKRILITGLTSTIGVDLVRAFADHKARLVLQFAEESERMDAVAEIAARSALEIASYGPVSPATDDVVSFARVAVQAYGGLDAVINLVPLMSATVDQPSSVDAIERLVEARLALPLLLSKIAANRMALMMTEGVVLNVGTIEARAANSKWAFAAVMKAALSTLTRAQAEEWAARAIRFHAIAPQTSPAPAGPSLAGEANVAQLALYLTSGRARHLSGCIFEAECGRAAA